MERSKEKLEKEAALRLVEERSRRLGMRGRLSWTYGGGREKPGEEIDQQAVEELEAERRTERVERAVLRTSLVERRELQRGASFPGRLGATAGGGGGGHHGSHGGPSGQMVYGNSSQQQQQQQQSYNAHQQQQQRYN